MKKNAGTSIRSNLCAKANHLRTFDHPDEVISTLKEGSRHCYGKRVYYLDEDSWLISVVDKYDKRGTLWRMSFAHGEEFYDFPVFGVTQYYHFDFQVDFYCASRFVNGLPPENYDELPDNFFTVRNLRKLGRK